MSTNLKDVALKVSQERKDSSFLSRKSKEFKKGFILGQIYNNMQFVPTSGTYSFTDIFPSKMLNDVAEMATLLGWQCIPRETLTKNLVCEFVFNYLQVN